MIAPLNQIKAGMAVVFGGDKVTVVDEALAAAFAPGDRLVVVQESGALLHVPAVAHQIATQAVDLATRAFTDLAKVSDDQITDFFHRFATHLGDDQVWAKIALANDRDVERAAMRHRSTTRLVADSQMRADMIAGLKVWRDAPAAREKVLERVEHEGWTVEQVTAPLGVVGFVFEGRPNVFADAAGVIRGGNSVVFRIGSDALGTARAIRDHALGPALAGAGLPTGAAVLIDSAAHAAGWALFSDPRLSLAVARGSGPAVAQLGAVARQSGVPVSLHGTGGAWLVADGTATAERFSAAVLHSLDRKVCNTLNVCCIVRDHALELVPLFVDAVVRAGRRRGKGARLHVGDGVIANPGEGLSLLPLTEADLGCEWEWEDIPEVSLILVDDMAQAIALFNQHSPRFAASLISQDQAAQDRFYAQIDAAFVGDGFTRWVDGQYAFNRPELGLSNWQGGRLFARGGVLSGDSVFTVRTRMRQTALDVQR